MKRTLSITVGTLAMSIITVALITTFTATTRMEYGMSILGLIEGLMVFIIFIRMENQLNNSTKY